MLFVPVLWAEVLAMPPETPIACQVCKHEATQTFAGTVRLAQDGRLAVFNPKTRESLGFAVPAGFRGVQSSDGQIKDAGLEHVRPGLLARVTYRTLSGRLVPSEVLLLTINQCRALMAAEKISDAKSGCPD